MRNWRNIIASRRQRVADGARRLVHIRPGFFLVMAGLLMVGGLTARSVGPLGDRSGESGTRLDSFREAAPFSMSFFDGWWGGSGHEVGDAITLVTDEMREEFFEEIPFGSIIHEKAEKYEIDPALVAAIVEVESGFETDARSSRGAVGLMQLRPATGRWMGARNLLDPTQNIEAGTKYLKYLEEKFEGDLDRQLAAYNAGEGVVTRYGGVPPYPETTRYIEKVMRRYQQRNTELKHFSRNRTEQVRAGENE